MPLILQRIAAHASYKPNLRIYNQMDAVGIDLEEQFPDWHRQSLSLDLINKEKHRRFAIAFNRYAYESLAPSNARDEIVLFQRCAEAVNSRSSIKQHERVGIDVFFATQVSVDFNVLVGDVERAFLIPHKKIPSLEHTKLKDLAYFVDLKLEDSVVLQLRLGPMDRKQWFQQVKYDRRMFDEENPQTSYRAIASKVPGCFLHIECEISRENCTLREGMSALTTAFTEVQDIAEKLSEYCLNGEE